MPASTLTIVKVIDLRHLSKRRACVGGLGVPMFISRYREIQGDIGRYGEICRLRGRLGRANVHLERCGADTRDERLKLGVHTGEVGNGGVDNLPRKHHGRRGVRELRILLATRDLAPQLLGGE